MSAYLVTFSYHRKASSQIMQAKVPINTTAVFYVHKGDYVTYTCSNNFYINWLENRKMKLCKFR